MKNISTEEAKYLAVSNQFLLKSNNGKTKNNVLKIIEQLGYVQIDTISVVERSHNHILWTRLPSYKQSMLHSLLEKDKKIFEYWFHAAAFLPMRDFRFSLYTKERFRKQYGNWMLKNKKMVNFVTDRIKAEGALRSKDFEHTGKKLTGWWDRKPAKAALECLFMVGDLMISSREGFQKAYDLTERVLPDGINTSIPDDEEMFEHLLLSRINSFGFASTAEAKYLRKVKPDVMKKVIDRLIEDKKIIQIKIGELKDIYYSSEEKLKQLRKKFNSELIHILSPFDNLVIQRKSLKNIFGFDYFLECYLPSAKRKFGYFNLPLLAGNEFIGTLDAKANRAEGKFIIRNLHLNGVSAQKNTALYKTIESLAGFTGCSPDF
ncbi:MAG: winged helix-turn-helix domain-containing protein [Ignavibacteriae bacterium]|nr:MAG: winged helix-turn-helix domain-containing protein [Ignavibacteriota bacterium]